MINRGIWVIAKGKLPLLGGFFKHEKIAEALHHTGKMSFELAGGSAGMILYMLNKEMPMGQTSLGEEAGYYADMVGSMSAGMLAGAVTFNTLTTVGKKTYHCFKPRQEENIEDILATESPNERAMVLQ